MEQRKLPKIKIIYQQSKEGSEEERKQRVARAYAVLFEETLKSEGWLNWKKENSK